jgi:hypothetical protein
MHVASCSKLVTAIAMVRLLAERGISVNDPIAPHLPDYWVKGPNVGSITFAMLLTHTSGFSNGTSSASDFGFMKGRVANGVAATGSYKYENMNFGLCRILIATINGNIAPSFDLPLLGSFNDVFWDSVTIDAYAQYVAASVFAPAGVSGPTLDHPDGQALAYQFPSAVPGWVSGDLRSMSGGAGWHLSVGELLDVMGTLRRGGSILSPAAAQTMLDRGFGIDEVISTPAGTLYDKNGYWMDGSGHAEQAVAYFLPEDMELAVLANSPFGSGTNIPRLRDTITKLHRECLKPIFTFPTNPTSIPAFVYAREPDGDLLWYRHDGAEVGGGVETWHGPATIGVGWGEFTHVFPGGGDVIYAIDAVGRLWWYEHKAFNDGGGLDRPDSWAGPRQVGRGWSDIAKVFSGGDGVIYVVADDGRLLWFRHHGVATGAGLDEAGSWSGPSEVGVGWDGLLHVFSTGQGVIYAVLADGTLRWFRHRGWTDGRGLESPGAWDGPRDVGVGWDMFSTVFSRGDGVIYGITADGTLRWYRHTGFQTGDRTWSGPLEVGQGWSAFTAVFALLPREPAPIR